MNSLVSVHYNYVTSCHTHKHNIFCQFVVTTLSIAMGKITVFSLDSCPYCKKAKELLRGKGAEFEEISLTKNPEWRQLLYLITNGEMGGDCYYIRKIKFILLYLYDPLALSHHHTVTLSQARRVFLRFSSMIVSLVDRRSCND